MDLQKRDEFKPRRRDETFARRLGEALDKMGTRNAGECPDGEILATYSERGLGPEESDKWENHFATCPRCRKILQVLAVSENTPLAGKEVARLGELVSAGRAPVEITKGGAKSGGPGIAVWRKRWLAPALGVAAVLAVWLAMRPPWRARDRSASENLIAQAPKEELPMSPPAEALDRLSKSAPQQDQLKMPAIPPARPSTKSLAQNSPAEPSAKAGADAASSLDNNLPSTDVSRGPLQADKKSGADVAGNESPALVSPRPSAKEMQAASESPDTPLPRANPAASAAATGPVQSETSANAISNPASRDGRETSRQQVAGAMAPAAIPPPATANARKTKSMMALKSAETAAVQATAPFGSTVWRVGKGGRIERSADAGETWLPQTSPSQEDWLAAVAISDTLCWAAGRSGAIARTVDGESWERVAPPAQAAGPDGKLPDWTGLAAHDGQFATITASDGRKFSTGDGGKTWQAQ